MQQIEDFYMDLGYKGDKLRQKLQQDKQLQQLLKKKRKKLTTSIKATSSEKRKYILSTDKDFEILSKCKKLKKIKISKEDKEIVNLIETQLKPEWRDPLVQTLSKLIKKYKI